MPLVIVTVAPEAEHAPLPTNVTAPVPLPPELPTVNVAPYAYAAPGKPVTTSVACVACEIVSVPPPFDGALKLLSPA